MAMAGSAVGLGNLWRFPYLVGTNGGGAFIFIYIVCSILLAMPIFFAEFLLGRRSGKNCVGAYKTFAPGSTGWKWVGIISIFTPAIVVSYYSVIGGWTLEYLFKACTFSFQPDSSQEELSGVFSDFVSSIWPPLFGFILFLFSVAFVVARGVKTGIERFGKVVMPALFFIVVAMAVYVGFQSGASKGYAYLFNVDFSKITPAVVLFAVAGLRMHHDLRILCEAQPEHDTPQRVHVGDRPAVRPDSGLRHHAGSVRLRS